MAVAFVLDFPGGTREQYDQVIERMELDGQLAPGGLFHAAGSYGGGWRVVDVWEDMAQFERFRDEKIVPYTAEVGLEPPQVRAVEVAERKPGSGATPALVQVVRLPGLDAERFAAADAEILAATDGPPPDVTFHVNGPEGDGWCVIDAWESKEARDRFIEERVRPIVESRLTGPPDVQDLTVEATLRSRETTTA
jgi:quinol monooxygenase YgiN